MDYFDIFDLKREPFSNSPDPDFFYGSPDHEKCLHHLEIALRLRRGLNVVLGEVGTGKTTLCRRLLRALGEDEAIRVHLLLDPYFSTESEFLGVLHGLICGREPEQGATHWQIKENIKSELYRYGVDEDRTTVLVIDEGQKIPEPCLEQLRELLNYETNDKKLLQIVIFAQSEFQQSLERFPNLADRVNMLLHLGPLNFSQTRTLVRHRLKCAAKGYSAPELFSLGGYRALHRATGGYPRKIVRLGHKVLLSLIMQNKRKASGAMVRACARDEAALVPGGGGVRLLPWAVAALVLLAVGAVALRWDQVRPLVMPVQSDTAALVAEPEPAAPAAAVAEPAKPQVEPVAPKVLAPEPTASEQTLAEPEPLRQVVAPAQIAPTLKANRIKPSSSEMMGSVVVASGESISDILHGVYGRYSPGLLRKVLRANPELGDPDRVQPGDVLWMPFVGKRQRDGMYWLQLDTWASLDGAYAAQRSIRARVDQAQVIPYWNDQGRLHYSVALPDVYESRQAAEAALEVAKMSLNLPVVVASGRLRLPLS